MHCSLCKNDLTRALLFQDQPKSLLKSKNQPVDDIIELDDEEMEVDEDSIQVNSLG